MLIDDWSRQLHPKLAVVSNYSHPKIIIKKHILKLFVVATESKTLSSHSRNQDHNDVNC